MASIKDFFASGSTAEMTRITHGTTCQQYTWGCCSLCCFCIPATSTTAWTVEMWGQGGGGASGCCCEWGCRGGGGANYGASRYENWSCGSAMPMCYCSCTCFCISPSSDGHPGQFSRVHNCQLSNFMCIGGGQWGCACCNYGGTPSYMQDINPDSDVNRGSGSSASGTTESGTTITGYQGNNNTTSGSGQDEFGNPFSGLAGGSSSGGGSNALDVPYPPQNSSCSSGWMLCTPAANCTLISRRGACGFSRLNGQCNVSCIRGGGGSSYAGGFQNECCFQNGQWAYCGCNGIIPGGGGVTAGVCGGGCCRGACGAPGVIMISYDA